MADPFGHRAEAEGDVVKREAAGARRQAVGDAEDGRAVFVSLGQGAISHLEPAGLTLPMTVQTPTCLPLVTGRRHRPRPRHIVHPHHDERDAFFARVLFTLQVG